MPRPQYDRAKVLAWYASLKNTLMGANINIDNPKDLARVKVYYFKESKNTRIPGDPSMFDGYKMSAFIPKKFSANNEMDGYTAPQPHMPNAQTQEELDTLLKGNIDANRDYLGGIDTLKRAYESKDKNRIDEAKTQLVELQNNVHSTFKTFKERGDDAFKDYYQWMYANQTKFDPERDYDQIEELYHSAMEGRLYINPLDSNPENRWQLVVTGDGSTSEFSKVGAKEDAKAADANSLLSAIDTIKKNKVPTAEMKPLCDIIRPLLRSFERDHGIIGEDGSASTKEIGKAPKAVAKPGVKSWLKAIFTLGYATGDFKKYNDYKAELATYNAQKAAAKEHNDRTYSQALKFANMYHKELGIDGPENMLNKGVVENSRMLMHTDEIVMGVENPEREIYNDNLHIVMLRHSQIKEHEVNHDNSIINPDGSLNVAKSQQYWNTKKELVLPILQEDRDKAFAKLKGPKDAYEIPIQNKAELDSMVKNSLDTGLNNDLADKQQKVLLKKTAQQNIKKVDETIDFNESQLLFKGMSKQEANDMVGKWSKYSVEDRIKQVGRLFGADPEKAWEKGIQMLAACVTRNQEYNPDGSERDYSKLRLDKEIINDLNELMEVAEHPETKEDHTKLIEDLKYVYEQSKNISSEMFYDSVASVVLTNEANTGSSECQKLPTGLFVCAQLAYRYAKQTKSQKGIDLSVDFKVKDNKNHTLSDKATREDLFKLGKRCFQVGQIIKDTKLNMQEKENIKNAMQKGTLGVDAPDLNIKRDKNFDLIKEPGLYH